MFAAHNALMTAGLATLPVAIKGSINTAASTSVTIPDHSAGDLIVIYASNGAGPNIPTKPSASGTVPTWTSIATTIDVYSHNALGVFYTVASASNHTSGTWSSVNSLSAAVLSNVNTTSPIGGSAAEQKSANPAPPTISTSGKSTALILYFVTTYFDRYYSGSPASVTIQATGQSSGHGYHIASKNDATTAPPSNLGYFGSASAIAAVEFLPK